MACIGYHPNYNLLPSMLTYGAVNATAATTNTAARFIQLEWRDPLNGHSVGKATGGYYAPWQYHWKIGTASSTSTASISIDWNWHWIVQTYSQTPVKTLAERMREVIANRHAPAVIGTRLPVESAFDAREKRARETLRLVVGDDQYRRFLKHGFVSARNRKSGKVYQIFGGTRMVNVYENGKHIERLCVYLSGSFPATDQIIVRYLMALNNEQQLWDIAIKHGPVNRANLAGNQTAFTVAGHAERAVDESLPLPELMRDFRKAFGLVA